METMQAILARRSVRSYQERPVERAMLTRLLEAAMAAPTACNAQPWEFLVVDTPQGIAKIRELMPSGDYNAPAAFIILSNLNKALNGCAEQYWIQDCTAALENILVAATSFGLGSVWLGCHPNPDREEAVRKAFSIPAEAIPLAIAYVGWPAETPEPRTQYEASRVHWNQYAG